jgi:hypothetical protein
MLISMGDVPTGSGNSLIGKDKKTRVMTFGGCHNPGSEFAFILSTSGKLKAYPCFQASLVIS